MMLSSPNEKKIPVAIYDGNKACLRKEPTILPFSVEKIIDQKRGTKKKLTRAMNCPSPESLNAIIGSSMYLSSASEFLT